MSLQSSIFLFKPFMQPKGQVQVQRDQLWDLAVVWFYCTYMSPSRFKYFLKSKNKDKVQESTLTTV